MAATRFLMEVERKRDKTTNEGGQNMRDMSNDTSLHRVEAEMK